MNSTKRLYRSRKERKIGGVCGGLAEYFGLDPMVVRVIFVLAALVWGAGCCCT
jgi:phage shock protein PspC (stress-responsive transcriptional regulator)